MAQEDRGLNGSSTDTTTRKIKGELLDWFTNNLFFAILPLFVSYLALSISRNPVTILDRGDAFIITAALLAPEIATLRRLRPTIVTGSVNNLLNVMFLMITLSTILFVASTSDYNTTHPDVTLSRVVNSNGTTSMTAVISNKAVTSPPFPNLPLVAVDILSILMLLVTIILIYYSMRERQRVGGAS
jgi:hypothetical protein